MVTSDPWDDHFNPSSSLPPWTLRHLSLCRVFWQIESPSLLVRWIFTSCGVLGAGVQVWAWSAAAAASSHGREFPGSFSEPAAQQRECIQIRVSLNLKIQTQKQCLKRERISLILLHPCPSSHTYIKPSTNHQIHQNLHSVYINHTLVFVQTMLTWHAKKWPLILTTTSSFSSGVWSLGTTTSAQDMFWRSVTCSQSPERERENMEQSIKPMLSQIGDSRMSTPAYSFSAFPDNASSSTGGNLDVSLQLHLFPRSKEILFLQFAKDATLSLQMLKKCRLQI